MEATASSPGPDIVLVDDSSAEGYVFTATASSLGIANRIVSLNSADAALEYLNDETERLPGLIILDVRMPGRTGLEALALLRESRRRGLAEVPVIVLSNSDDPRDRDAARELGALDYVVKPENLAGYRAFLTELQNYLKGSVQPATP